MVPAYSTKPLQPHVLSHYAKKHPPMSNRGEIAPLYIIHKASDIITAISSMVKYGLGNSSIYVWQKTGCYGKLRDYK